MKRILLIDDDEGARQLSRQILELAKYKVVSACNGIEATDILKKSVFDIIITDIVMPDKDGLEIIRDVRKQYPDTKLIAVSGGGNVSGVEYLNIARLFGAQITLEKPYSDVQLLKAISKVLEMKFEGTE